MSTIHSVNIGGSLYNVADSSNLAPIEATMTASRAYEIGRFVVLKDGLLYRTKTAIAQGDAFVINTNVERRTFDEVYSSDMKMAVNNATINMLNPYLTSGEWSGVTVVKNADNSYTISGTNTTENTRNLILSQIADVAFETGKTYRMLGCPSNTPEGVSMMIGSRTSENGDGVNFTFPVASGQSIYISIAAGAVIDPAITVRPMITTNLSANYNDYVPYTGNTGKLSGDVANIRKDVIIAQNGIAALNTGLATKIEYIRDISNKYSNLSELYTAGQTNELKMGTFQWNRALRPEDTNGYVFIGNWSVAAIRGDFTAVFRLNSNSTWTKVVDLQQIMTS